MGPRTSGDIIMAFRQAFQGIDAIDYASCFITVSPLILLLNVQGEVSQVVFLRNDVQI